MRFFKTIVSILFLGFTCIGVWALVPLNDEIFEEIEALLHNTRKSYYTHVPFVDESNGEYGVDCSSLVQFILEKRAPDALLNVPVEEGASRPRAAMFYQAMKEASQAQGLGGWMVIESVEDLRPGDVLAWEKIGYTMHSDSGHVMFVYGLPEWESENGVAIRVFDSTHYSHAEDTRNQAEGGVGHGIIRFVVDAKHHPIAYYFSDRMKKPKFRDIMMARIVGL